MSQSISGSEPIKSASVGLPRYARAFAAKGPDEVSFGALAPLADQSPWSVVALVRPVATNTYAGIVSRRTAFAVGSHQFTFWLKNRAIAVEADATSSVSKLVPPINEWSYVGATAAKHGTRMYLGVGGDVRTEDGVGLVTGTSGAGLPLTIGKLGGNFPGSIAFVCLYTQKLRDETMSGICAGNIDPFQVLGLNFAWIPTRAGDLDRVSRHVPAITGTRLISLRKHLPKLRPESAEPSAGALSNVPHLDEGGMQAFVQYLKGTPVYLEYGSGSSTVFAAEQGVKDIISVESDPAWARVIREAVVGHERGVHLLHCDLGPIATWGKPVDNTRFRDFYTYAVLPWKTAANKNLVPTLVLIDGRFRVACFLYSLLCAQPGTPILLDDYAERPQYHVVERFCDLHERRGRVAVFLSHRKGSLNDIVEQLLKYSTIPD